ncbi:hypothetical protein QTI66_39050 [Variovorax sp. J22R133]|uniref:hypothetical protein n=1 Tax=Variovorax brevis TaxID=3053503 RepID=UPI0025769F5F|nr:hypothetical protein [Variovorax sp. J22R133]MDM0118073.1 hypothetical protein [Variovorax sp. J22R133]
MSAEYIVIAVLVAAILLVMRKPWKLPRLQIACALLLLVIAAAYIYGVQMMTLGGKWFDASPWRELILFLLMVLGMFARTLSLAIEARRARLKAAPRSKKTGIALDVWDLFYPFLFSVITFGSLMVQIGERDLSLVNLVLAFQTGFFWQTILQRSEREVAAA